MQTPGKFALLFLIIQTVCAAPQSYSQSFSSSSFVGPNGQVYQNSVYQDSNGNRWINGVPQYRPVARPAAATARPVAARPVAAAPVARPVAAAPVARPVQYQTTRAVQYQTTKRPTSG